MKKERQWLCSDEGNEAERGCQQVEGSVEETLTYCNFPNEHQTWIRTNNVIERRDQEE